MYIIKTGNVAGNFLKKFKNTPYFYTSISGKQITIKDIIVALRPSTPV